MNKRTGLHQTPSLSLATIREGGKRALSRALSALEAKEGSEAIARLLDEAAEHAQAHVVGLTGPPGVGKSTLTNSLIRHWRAKGERVGVVAVDPSSRFSMGLCLVTGRVWIRTQATRMYLSAPWQRATALAAFLMKLLPPLC